MKQTLLLSRILLIVVFAFPVTHLLAQNNLSVSVDRSKTRVPLEVSAGSNRISLEHLMTGRTYEVVASRAAAGELAELALNAEAGTANSATALSRVANRKTALRFTALGATVPLELTASGAFQESTLPVFVSVRCLDCQDDEKKKASLAESLANLNISFNSSAENLIKNTLIGGDCFAISNVKAEGNFLSRGTFSNGNSSIGIDQGIVMSTGRINILPGPNLAGDSDGGFNDPGYDEDLRLLVDDDLNDINVIEFDFTPTANTIKFDFVFGSEEYCEFVGTEYNDVFGFFISGPGISGVKNLAVVPGTGNVPVTVNNINHNTHSNYYVNNSSDFFGCNFLAPHSYFECELDGWTKLLTATTTVIPCATYHIKLAICDVNDALYDSAVFLRANSFNAGGTVSAAPAYRDNQTAAAENCAPGSIRFARSNNDLSQALPVNFTVAGSSTATPGLDYVALTSPQVIPVGQKEIFVPVQVLPDGLAEGQEKIVLLIDNSCQCQGTQIEYLINDNQEMLVHVVQDTSVCEGSPVFLAASVEGGIEPLHYVWSTGDTSSFTIVVPTVNTLYTVTVTDGCGATATDDAIVEVLPIFRNTVHVSLCPGETFELGGQLYSDAVTLIDTAYDFLPCGRITTFIVEPHDAGRSTKTLTFCYGDSVEVAGHWYSESATVFDTLSTVFGCDSIITYQLTRLPRLTGEETIRFCAGSTVTINGQQYGDSGTLTQVYTSAAGCDSTVHYKLVRLPNSTGAQTKTFCPGESVLIGGHSYEQPGVVLDTLTSANGCDSVVTYTLVLLPQPTRSETVGICPGESIVVAGVTITGPGSLVVYDPAAVGCDTMVNYTFVLATVPTLTKTIRFCQGESVVLGGITYTQPGTVVLKLPASQGCDTIATYTLQYAVPAPSNIQLQCPAAVTVGVPSGVLSATVSYNNPTAGTDCVCPGLDLHRSAGPASGSVFPMGVTQVCYTAQDACGQSKSCCFNVTVEEDDPCDVKAIGCLKYELLTITQDAAKNKTYRIRVTNNCSNQLVYTVIQLPAGVTAMSPANGGLYTAPSGNSYLVRNPNASPFYSIRFKSSNLGISNGGSDILKYTLPAQADVLFLRIGSRLDNQQYYEAHLNTFYCPIGNTVVSDRPEDRDAEMPVASNLLYPNPTTGNLEVDWSEWSGESLRLEVLDGMGRRVWSASAVADAQPYHIELPRQLSGGLYFLDISTESGEKTLLKFMLSR